MSSACSFGNICPCGHNTISLASETETRNADTAIASDDCTGQLIK